MRNPVARFASDPVILASPETVLQAILNPKAFGVVYGSVNQIFFWYNLPPHTLIPECGLKEMSHEDGHKMVCKIQSYLERGGMTLRPFTANNAVIITVTAEAPAPAPEAAGLEGARGFGERAPADA